MAEPPPARRRGSIELGRFRASSGQATSDYAHLTDVALTDVDTAVPTGDAGDTPTVLLSAGSGQNVASTPGGGADGAGARAAPSGVVAKVLAAWNSETSSIPGTVFNVSNTVIGAGILSGASAC